MSLIKTLVTIINDLSISLRFINTFSPVRCRYCVFECNSKSDVNQLGEFRVEITDDVGNSRDCVGIINYSQKLAEF